LPPASSSTLLFSANIEAEADKLSVGLGSPFAAREAARSFTFYSDVIFLSDDHAYHVIDLTSALSAILSSLSATLDYPLAISDSTMTVSLANVIGFGVSPSAPRVAATSAPIFYHDASSSAISTYSSQPIGSPHRLGVQLAESLGTLTSLFDITILHASLNDPFPPISYTVRAAFVFSQNCSTSYFPDKTTGQCVSCSTVPESDYAVCDNNNNNHHNNNNNNK